MKLIYVHLDPTGFPFSNEFKQSDHVFEKIPNYAYLSLTQSSNLGYEPEIIANDLGSLPFIDVSKYNDKITVFFELCKKGFPSFYNDPFWFLPLLRLYVLALHANEQGYEKFIHMEYDNLVYYGPEALDYLEKGIYCTQVGPQCGSAGFMYVNGKGHLTLLVTQLGKLIQKGENIVKGFTGYTHLSEMILLDLVHQHTDDLKYLPLFPTDPYYESFGFVFDGASYGQYLGGTNCGDGKGWHGMHHHVGQKIHQKVITDIEMVDNKPQVWYNDEIVNIFNLHIHSKNLAEFAL